MKTRLRYRTLILLMVTACTAATVMADANAMLYANGNVTINGTAVVRSSAIVGGDTVRTEKGASAMIADGQCTVRLSSGSSLIYGRDDIGLNYGAAVVVAKQGTTGHVAGLSVSPMSGTATKFGLVNQNGKEAIAAIEGSLRITDGSGVVVLLPGHILTRESNMTAQAGSGNNQVSATASQEGNTQGSQESGKGKTPTTTGSSAAHAGIPGWGIELMVEGALGGALGGLAVTGAFDGPISPSKP